MRLTRKGYYPQTEQILNRNCAKQKTEDSLCYPP